VRRLLRRSYWLGNSITMLFVVAFVAFLVQTDLRNDRNSLNAILSTASAWTTEASSNLQQLADKIADSAPPMRVTFLMPNGIILADSGLDDQDGKALLARPEVQDALTQGAGEGMQWDAGLFHPSLTAAAKLNDRLLLHLNMPINEIRHLLVYYIPGMVLLFGLLNLISRLMLYPATNKLVAQLTQVQHLLEGTVARAAINPDDYFPEIRQVMVTIGFLSDRLRRDLEQVQQSRDMQRDFVDNTSHELKSPLTSIVGFAEMLAEGDLSDQKQQEYLGYIIRESTRMIAVINDILMLEHAEAPADDLEQVDMHHVAQEVRSSLQPQAAEKDIRVSVTGELTVTAVEQDMWELIRNLVSNAIRYGSQGGWVRVMFSLGRMTVADNGIGIEEEHLPRVFEKFYRADKSRSRNEGGTGLGLSIVANIVLRYGASIHVDSQPGQGTTFTVDFVRNL
jgi:two-component system phosphate regulon sensor histidine kinase PhoR